MRHQTKPGLPDGRAHDEQDGAAELTAAQRELLLALYHRVSESGEMPGGFYMPVRYVPNYGVSWDYLEATGRLTHKLLRKSVSAAGSALEGATHAKAHHAEEGEHLRREVLETLRRTEAWARDNCLDSTYGGVFNEQPADPYAPIDHDPSSTDDDFDFEGAIEALTHPMAGAYFAGLIRHEAVRCLRSAAGNFRDAHRRLRRHNQCGNPAPRALRRTGRRSRSRRSSSSRRSSARSGDSGDDGSGSSTAATLTWKGAAR